MKTLKFKTNMKCKGCVSSVAFRLNSLPGLSKWEVDLEHPDKLLIVETITATEEEIIAAVAKAGYESIEVKE